MECVFKQLMPVSSVGKIVVVMKTTERVILQLHLHMSVFFPTCCPLSEVMRGL